MVRIDRIKRETKVKHFLPIDLKDRHRRILSLIRKNSTRLVFAAGSSLMISGATTAMGYMIKPVIDDIFVNKDTTGLLLLPLLLLQLQVKLQLKFLVI